MQYAASLRMGSLTSFSQMMDICITFDLKFVDLIGIEKAYHEDYTR